MTYTPRRRGPNRPKAASTEPSAPTETPADPPKRRRRAKVGGHAMKLSAPARPGFVRRFFNDDANRIAEAEELGYDPVSDKAIKTSGLGSTVSRLAGTKANGGPLQTILMETPEELYAQGLAEKEAACAAVDDAIRAGRDSTGQMSSAETYGRGSIEIER